MICIFKGGGGGGGGGEGQILEGSLQVEFPLQKISNNNNTN
jgi:hypothetical protein